MKKNILKCMALVLSLVCILCFPVPASAASQGTDGTELEVVQPANLEIQLGEAWAGVEFELKTDAGMYPGVIAVGQDGVLRLEIGGSENYILSCLNSSVEIPIPGETAPAEEVTEPAADPTEEAAPSEEATPAEESAEGTEPNQTEAEEAPDGTVAGIPIAHLALFGGGLVIAIGGLVGIHFYQKKRQNNASDDDDENDEI